MKEEPVDRIQERHRQEGKEPSTEYRDHVQINSHKISRKEIEEAHVDNKRGEKLVENLGLCENPIDED